MEVEPYELLSGRMASNWQRARHRWSYLHNVTLQEERRISPEDKLQPARAPLRRKNEIHGGKAPVPPWNPTQLANLMYLLLLH